MINYELFEHQKRGLCEALTNNGNFGLFFEMGLGKCLTSLEIFKALRAKNPNLRLLVICPKSLINLSWGEDIKRFSDFTYSALKDSDKGDILLINFELLITKRYFSKAMQLVSTGDFMCVIDESARMKSHSSLTTKTILKLRDYFKHRLILTGVPCPNNETEYWAQIRFISDVFPPSFFQFRNQYFHLARGNQVIPQGAITNRWNMQEYYRKGYKYEISAQNRERLLKLIAPYVLWKSIDETDDMPERIDIFREVELSPVERKAYEDMRKYLVAEIGDITIASPLALTKLLKLRECTSGFMYDDKLNAIEIGNSKLNELEEVLEELGQKQAIIFIEFKHELHKIEQLLVKKYGCDSYTTLYSETDDKDEAIRLFTSGQARYLIANTQSGSHGLNLQSCHTIIYFSLSYSYEKYSQSKGRIFRKGQKNNCVYIHLIAAQSIDQIILKTLQRKGSLLELAKEIIG